MNKSKLEARPLRLTDVNAFTRTATAIGVCSGTDEQFRANDTLLLWQEPGFDLESSSLGIFAEGGSLAAYVILWATAETPVHPWVNWGVHPDFHSHGLSDELFCWAEEKGREVMQRCPPEARVSLKSDTPQGYDFAETALKHAGYKAMRLEYEMRIEMSERPTVSQLPNGLVFQPYRHEEDLPMFVDVFRNTFSDHYGYIEEPFEKDLEEFRHWFNNDEQFDPSLVILTVDKPLGIAAGCLLGLKEDYRHPGCGYIDIVGVRREYRKRGLAQVMLCHSFASFWDRGLRRVNLGVDGESLTNAVALYEKVGMHIHRSYMSYEMVLREGVELAKVAMD